MILVKIRYTLKNRNGNGMPLAVAVTLSLLLILLAISQYVHLMIIAAGIKDAMQEAVISTINDNYADVYHAVREGYAAGYQPEEGFFQESVQEGDIYERLDDLLGLEEENGYHYKITSGGNVEFQLHGLQVTIQNAALASGELQSFEAVAQIQLEVSVSFLQKVLPDMKITLQAKAAYTPKF